MVEVNEDAGRWARPETPQGRFFSGRTLAVAALGSAVIAAGWSWRESTIATAFSAEVRIAATEAGAVQLFYDRGAGMNEADSTQWQLMKNAVALRYEVALPVGRMAALRFDPLDRDGTVSIDGPVRILAPGGRVVREIAVTEFKAAEQIKSWREENGRLEVIVEPGASDPKLVADFSPALELRATWWDLQSGFWLRAVAGWLELATVRWAVGRAPATPGLTRWQRLRRFLARPPLGITLAACAAVLAARRPEMFSNPQFWAEDSTVFYHGAYTRGATAIFEPYASYLHLVPRLTAALAMGIDPRLRPRKLNRTAGEPEAVLGYCEIHYENIIQAHRSRRLVDRQPRLFRIQRRLRLHRDKRKHRRIRR